MIRRLLITTALITFAAAPSARAQGVEGTRSVSVFVGTGFSLSGNAVNEAAGTVEGRPAVFVEQAMSNHFSDALRIRFTGAMGLDYNKEAFVAFAYGKFNGTERLVGSVSGYPLYARFSNADAFDVEGGLRYYLQPEGTTRTYVAGVLGLRHLQATDVTFRAPDAGVTLNDLPYYEGSWLFIFGADTGLTYDLSDRMAIGGEIGLRYQGKPSADDLFADPALAVVNDTGSRWSIPISASLTVRF